MGDYSMVAEDVDIPSTIRDEPKRSTESTPSLQLQCENRALKAGASAARTEQLAATLRRTMQGTARAMLEEVQSLEEQPDISFVLASALSFMGAIFLFFLFAHQLAHGTAEAIAAEEKIAKHFAERESVAQYEEAMDLLLAEVRTDVVVKGYNIALTETFDKVVDIYKGALPEEDEDEYGSPIQKRLSLATISVLYKQATEAKMEAVKLAEDRRSGRTSLDEAERQRTVPASGRGPGLDVRLT